LEKRKTSKKELLKNLSSELNEFKKSLSEDIDKLYPDIWDSAVASGRLELLDSEQLTKLTNAYRKIKGTDYDATRVREAQESFNESMSQENRRHLSFQRLKYESRTKETKALINEVLNEPWLR